MFVVWEKQHAADRPKHRSHYADRHNHRLSQTSRVGQRTKKDWFSIGFTVFETARQHRVGLVSACVRLCACVCVRVCVWVRVCASVCVCVDETRKRERKREMNGVWQQWRGQGEGGGRGGVCAGWKLISANRMRSIEMSFMEVIFSPFRCYSAWPPLIFWAQESLVSCLTFKRGNLFISSEQ